MVFDLSLSLLIMNVKVAVGKTFKAFDIKQKEDENRIALLERSIIDREKEGTELKAEIVHLKGTIKKMNDDYNALSKSNVLLNDEIKVITNQHDKLKDNMMSSSKSNSDLIDSNRKLQLEIERLNMIVSSKDKSESKINEEYNQMTKIKNGFEDKIIALSSTVEQLSSKIASYEQIGKQKDKYIQMLLNNSNKGNYKSNTANMQSNDNNVNTNNNRLHYIVKPSYNKDTSSNLQTDSNIINNFTLLKNKLTEKESVIYHLIEEIKSLKKDNGNLLTRLKNSTSNSSSALMKKAI